MDTVNVEWDKGVIRFDQIKVSKSGNLDKKGFYAIIGWTYDETSKGWKNLNLLYIGQAFEQDLRERIPQEHDAYKCVYDYKKSHSGSELFVMIGIIRVLSRETNSTVIQRHRVLLDIQQQTCMQYNMPRILFRSRLRSDKYRRLHPSEREMQLSCTATEDKLEVLNE